MFSDTDTTDKLKIQLWTGYGLGINGDTLFFRTGGSFYRWKTSTDALKMQLDTNGGLAIYGSGRLLIVGDDAAFHDVNLSNTLALKGEQNSNIGRLQLGASAYIQGNADGTMDIS